ncbi:MAG: type II toxin-antitoxin system HicA family toxin [Candidatus Omnitrophica bacterium]|nr:type II toxin-antitoxin system HicA family toxin [Candidatus Omnitrophota bacterium]
MKLPRISGRELVKALSRAGYLPISQRGSHIKLRHTVTG